jgi:hypothetical protein
LGTEAGKSCNRSVDFLQDDHREFDGLCNMLLVVLAVVEYPLA